MKLIKIMLPIVLAITLVAGIGLIGVAAQEPDPQETPEELQADNPQPENSLKAWGNRLRGFWGGKQTENPNPNLMPRFKAGEVIEVDEANSYFVIQRGENEPVTIAVDNDTRYYLVSKPGNVIGLIKSRLQARNQNSNGTGAVQPAALNNPGQMARQRMAAGQQNGAVANGSRSGAMSPRSMNAARLKKMNGFDQAVSTPMANPEVLPVNDADTEGWMKRFGEEATFGDIEVGDRVAVRLVPGDEKPVARLVLIYKPSPCKSVGGTITEVSPDNQTITIAPADDSEAVTLRYNEDTIFHLKGIIAVEPGQVARAMYLIEDMMAKAVRVFPEGTEFSTPGTE